MSRLIKSSRIVLGDHHYNISSEITRPPVGTDDSGGFDSALNADSRNYQEEADRQLVLNAEQTAQDILNQAEHKAEQLIEQAEAEARRIESETVAKAKRLYDKNRADAQDEGFAQGFDAGQSEAQVYIDEALMIKEEWQLNKNQFVNRMEKDIVDLCMRTVKLVINREISDPSYILDLIKRGIDHLTYTASLTVRVSDYDYDFASANKSKVLAMVEGVEDIEIKKDLSLDHGDCVIDTDTGSIDVGIDSQLNKVESLFTSLLSGE